MKLKVTYHLLSLFIISASVQAVEAENSAFLEESRQIAQGFLQRLGSTLKSQLKTADPVSAIAVCKQAAPALAAEYSRAGFLVNRVSLKTRNKALGSPDAWERTILEKFDQQQAQGVAIEEISEITEQSDGRWFRYMKAIPTQPMCLQCHGKPDDMTPAVTKMLTVEYPDDQALGYLAGDIRGAVSIKRKLRDQDE